MKRAHIDTLPLVDFKVRSKLYFGFNEASEGAQEDFESKLKHLYLDDAKHSINFILVMNPSFGPEALHNSLIRKFGASASVWEENCCGTIFFSESTSEDEDEEDDSYGDSIAAGSEWMFKYEIYFSEDAIEFTKNGEYVFNPVQISHMSITSSYH